MGTKQSSLPFDEAAANGEISLRPHIVVETPDRIVSNTPRNLTPVEARRLVTPEQNDALAARNAAGAQAARQILSTAVQPPTDSL